MSSHSSPLSPPSDDLNKAMADFFKTQEDMRLEAIEKFGFWRAATPPGVWRLSINLEENSRKALSKEEKIIELHWPRETLQTLLCHRLGVDSSSFPFWINPEGALRQLGWDMLMLIHDKHSLEGFSELPGGANPSQATAKLPLEHLTVRLHCHPEENTLEDVAGSLKKIALDLQADFKINNIVPNTTDDLFEEAFSSAVLSQGLSYASFEQRTFPSTSLKQLSDHALERSRLQVLTLPKRDDPDKKLPFLVDLSAALRQFGCPTNLSITVFPYHEVIHWERVSEKMVELAHQDLEAFYKTFEGCMTPYSLSEPCVSFLQTQQEAFLIKESLSELPASEISHQPALRL